MLFVHLKKILEFGTIYLYCSYPFEDYSLEKKTNNIEINRILLESLNYLFNRNVHILKLFDKKNFNVFYDFDITKISRSYNVEKSFTILFKFIRKKFLHVYAIIRNEEIKK